MTEELCRAKFEEWFNSEYKHLESSKYTDLVPHIKFGFWNSWLGAWNTRAEMEKSDD